MIGSRKIALAIGIVSVLLFVASVCYAAESPLTVGVVDVTKVYAEAPRIKQLREQLDKRRVELSTKLEIRGQSLMLSEEQVRELIDLKLKPTPTEAEKTKIKQLVDLERANDDELKTLQGTAQPTDAQKTRMNELAEIQKKSKTIGEQMERDYNSQLQNEAMGLESKAATEIEEVIKTVAQAKKLSFVFAKDAVFFGGVDVTTEVIGKLDRKPE